MTALLIPIHPRHAQAIYEYRKRFEFRKQLASRNIEIIVFYETKPVGRVTGFATVTGCLSGSKTRIWEMTKVGAGISRALFRDYFKSSKQAFAYCLGDIYKLIVPIELSEIGIAHAPQAPRYLSLDFYNQLMSLDYERPVRPREAVFVGGVHGVGKTTFSRELAEALNMRHHSSSELIAAEHTLDVQNKTIQSSTLHANQDALISMLRKTDWYANGGYLDGHFVLKSEDQIEKVPLDTFEKLNLSSIVVVKAKPCRIASRSIRRDGSCFDISTIIEMQEMELHHARVVANSIGIPMHTVNL